MLFVHTPLYFVGGGGTLVLKKFSIYFIILLLGQFTACGNLNFKVRLNRKNFRFGSKMSQKKNFLFALQLKCNATVYYSNKFHN